MADLKYNFLDNSFFTTYQNVEVPKVELNLPIMDAPMDISDWASGIAEDGTPIVKDNRPRLYMINDNNPEPEVTLPPQDTQKKENNTSKTYSNNNAEVVISTLMADLGLTRSQAAGIAGVLEAESGIDPQAFNRGEKNGTYSSSSANNKGEKYGHKNSPWSYGAGIGQWTFTDRKEKAIMGGLGLNQDEARNLIKTKGIESLSLEQQIKMLEYELTNNYKNTLEGIKKCTKASDAAATFYCHAIAGYSDSKEKATLDEINKMNKRYSKVGAKALINKGMKNAEKYVK